MPTMHKVFRAPGHRNRLERRRQYDADRSRAYAWRAWYQTPQWKAIRLHQLAIEPCCRKCAARGVVTLATVCDHVEPHHGDRSRFFAGPFQALCDACHSSAKQREERAIQPA